MFSTARKQNVLVKLREQIQRYPCFGTGACVYKNVFIPEGQYQVQMMCVVSFLLEGKLVIRVFLPRMTTESMFKEKLFI